MKIKLIICKLLPNKLKLRINEYRNKRFKEKYKKNVIKRDMYTKNHRSEINDQLEEYLKNDNYFLGFGCVLKYYRDKSFEDEDLDYVISGESIDKLININSYNKNFKLILEAWKDEIPITFKLLYKNKAIIDFFVLNKIDDESWVFAKSAIEDRDIPKLNSPRKKYKHFKYTNAEKYKYIDRGTKLVNFNGSSYRFPINIEEYLMNQYGDWRVKRNKEESYKYSLKISKKVDGYIECYWNYKYA